MMELKTNTDYRLVVGPLVSYTDGHTPQTSVTVGSITAELFRMKNDNTAVVRTALTLTASGGSNDMVPVPSNALGLYDLEITASQINWYGNGKIGFYDATGFLIHWMDISVVSADYFNWKYGTTIPAVNTTQVNGTSQTAGDLADMVGNLPSAVQAEMEENGASLLDTIRDAVESGTYGLSALKTIIDELTTQGDTNESKLDVINGIVDSVLEDTGTTLPATLSSIAGYVDTEIADIESKIDVIDGIVDSILEDTNNLQTNQGNWATATGFMPDTEDGTSFTSIPNLDVAVSTRSSHSASDVWDVVIENSRKAKHLISSVFAFAKGLVSGATGDATDLVYRNDADDTDRITITVDQYGNRTVSTSDFSDMP